MVFMKREKAFQCVYVCSDERKNGNEEDRSEISRGGEGVEITWPFVCRELGFVCRVGGRPDSDGRVLCWAA